MSSWYKSNDLLSTDSLFSSGKASDSVESKENGTQAPKTSAPSKAVPAGAVVAGGGLFDDEDDDLFNGKSQQKSDTGKFVRIPSILQQSRFSWDPHPYFVCYFSAGKEKPKPKTTIDLFYEDDEDGDIFSDKHSVPVPAQSKKEAVVEQAKPPEKKVKINMITFNLVYLHMVLWHVEDSLHS